MTNYSVYEIEYLSDDVYGGYRVFTGTFKQCEIECKNLLDSFEFINPVIQAGEDEYYSYSYDK